MTLEQKASDQMGGKCDTDDRVMELIERYGGIDGAHHKQWLIDQIARVIQGDDYEHWVIAMKDGENGPETYEWDTGIAP